MSVYAINNLDSKFIFIINYKVMYSSLYRMLHKHFPTIKFYHKKDISKINFNNYPKFAIVRNPYDRAVSTFYGKCRKSPDLHLQKEKTQLEYSQYQLLSTLKEVRNQDFAVSLPATFYTALENPEEWTILRKNFKLLSSISFEEFVTCLNLILKRKKADAHFQEQYKVFTIPGRFPFYFPLRIDKDTEIIKLENIAKGWVKICEQIGTDMTLLKINSTDQKRPNFEKCYTTSTRNLIAKLYKVDFKRFGYAIN